MEWVVQLPVAPQAPLSIHPCGMQGTSRIPPNATPYQHLAPTKLWEPHALESPKPRFPQPPHPQCAVTRAMRGGPTVRHHRHPATASHPSIWGRQAILSLLLDPHKSTTSTILPLARGLHRQEAQGQRRHPDRAAYPPQEGQRRALPGSPRRKAKAAAVPSCHYRPAASCPAAQPPSCPPLT
jgi:hypothetical protein